MSNVKHQMRAPLLLLAALSLAPLLAHAESRSLCLGNERSLWACTAGSRRYELCASRDLSASQGYMQYRAGKGSVVEMAYPTGKHLPQGHFTIAAYIHAAGIHFQVGHYSYELLDQNEGGSSVSVWKDEAEVGQIYCEEENDLFNSTKGQEYFAKLGVQ